MKKYLFLIPLSYTLLYSQNIKILPSFQSYSGLWSTPNAKVIESGNIQLSFHKNNIITNYRSYKNAKNYLMGIGILPYTEFYGRFTLKMKNSSTIDLSDRVFSAKVTAPLNKFNKFLPQIAIGTQDFKKNANFSSKYIVASKEIGNIRFSIGYGNNLLHHLFGGFEWQIFPWMQFVTDYNNKVVNSGFKFTKDFRSFNRDMEVALFVKKSFGKNKVDNRVNFGFMIASNIGEKQKEITKKEKIVYKNLTPSNRKKEFKSKLSSKGYQNIKIKEDSKNLYLSFENSIYDWNDIDAIKDVLKLVAIYYYKSDIKYAYIQLTKSFVDIKTLKVDIKKYTLASSKNELKDAIKEVKSINLNTPIANSNILYPNLVIYPDFIFIDGSEVGNFEHLISIKSELYTNIFKNTIASIRVNSPIIYTNNFKKGKPLYNRKRYPLKSVIDNALLTTYLKPFKDIKFYNELQLGLFDYKLYGAMYQGIYLFGNSRVKLKLARFKDNLYHETHNIALASYGYYWNRYDIDFKVSVGKFLYGDKGAQFELKKYFSNSYVSLSLSRTKMPYSNHYDNIGRINISIPFTPKKRYNGKYLSVRGKNLVYRRQKTIITHGHLSYVKPRSAIEPVTNFEIENYLFNSNRITKGYIINNLSK